MCTEIISLSKEVKTLLAEAQLPVSDLHEKRNLVLLGIREQGRLVGVIGVEAYGAVGLLRSLAVVEARRRSGLGRCLTAAAEQWAAEQGIKTLYLLTTTASEFFARLGYEVIPRSEAPAAVAATAQFSGLCPASSTFMRKVSAAHSNV